MAENRIYGYARVSKQDGMTIENQEHAINKWAQENNVTISMIYKDKCQGDTPVNKRQQLPVLLENLREGDTVVVFECFRLHRSPSGLQEVYREIIEKKKAEFVSLNPMEQILCTYNNGNDDIVQQGFKQIILAVMSVMGAIEKKNISVRTKNSLAQRKENGVQLGRPKVEIPENFKELFEKAARGEISHSSLYNKDKEHKGKFNMSRAQYYKIAKQLGLESNKKPAFNPKTKATTTDN